MVVTLMTAAKVIDFENVETFNHTALKAITDHTQAAISTHGTADLLLSGGSTPKAVYENLSRVDLDWNRVRVGQVDERWVGLDNPGSNGAFIRRTLLRNAASNAELIRMKSRHSTAQKGRDSLEADYAKFNLQNSLAVLGMGTDGHIAGWFPQSEGLENAVNPDNPNRIAVINATPSKVTGPYLERITLTLSALAQCSKLLLLITGEEKKKVLTSALSTPSEHLPISHLLRLASYKLTIMQTG